MPIVTFLPSGRRVEVERGTTLFDAVLRAGLPIASSCDQQLVCGKCNLQVSEGRAELSPQRDLERRLLRKEGKPLTDRIGCATRVYGDCTVRATYW